MTRSIFRAHKLEMILVCKVRRCSPDFPLSTQGFFNYRKIQLGESPFKCHVILTWLVSCISDKDIQQNLIIAVDSLVHSGCSFKGLVNVSRRRVVPVSRGRFHMLTVNKKTLRGRWICFCVVNNHPLSLFSPLCSNLPSSAGSPLPASS